MPVKPNKVPRHRSRGVRQPAILAWARRWPFYRVAMLVFMAALCAQGGIARFDVVAQLWPRVAALIIVASMYVSAVPCDLQRVRWPMTFVGLAASLLLLQLMPLPSILWVNLPGRSIYAPLAAALEEQQGWRSWSITPDRTWNALASLTIPAATLFAMAHYGHSDRGKILWLILAMVVISAILGLLQLSSGDLSGFQIYSAVTSFSAGGIFANRNHQALFLATGLPMLAVLAIDYRPAWAPGSVWTWLCVGLGIFILLTIPTTGSRAGLVAGCVGLIGAIAISWPFIARNVDRLRPRQRTFALGAMAMTLVGILLIGLLSARSESVRRLFADDGSGNRRLETIGSIVQMVRAFFPAGSGFGSFDPVFRHFEQTSTLSTFYLNQAHNEYLQVAAEGGLPGVSLLLAAIVWLVTRAYQVLTAVSEPAIRLARLGALVLAMIALAAVVDYPTRTPVFMMYIAVAAAWLEAGAVERRHRRAALYGLR